MYLIISETKDPSFNLALDEFLLKKSNDEFLILGINSTSVISGKHQCIHKETNTRYLVEKNIPVLRRITGGGTVFHDDGNLNYSFILNSEPGKQVDFHKYTLPVIGFLESLGLSVEIQGSDIRVCGGKISGNAEHIHRNRVLHHGTLLFDADLEKMRGSIRKDVSHYETRAVASNPSRVINIREIKPGISDINELMSLIILYFQNTLPGIESYKLKSAELSEITDLAKQKYNSWEWNIAYGPEYIFSNSLTLDDNEISLRLYVREGIIRDIVLNEGTYHHPAFEKLKGKKHMPQEIKEFFESESVTGFDKYSFF